MPRSNAETHAETRAKLLDAGRLCFADYGFEATTTSLLVSETGLTRGALYYHFKDKRELFAAVLEAIQAELVEQIDNAARMAQTSFGALLAGTEAFLDACTAPDVQRILLEDGPSVLGWTRWREIDARHSMGALQLGIEACIADGELAKIPAATATHLLSGAMNEAVMLIADAGTAHEQLRQEVGALLARMLRSLQA